MEKDITIINLLERLKLIIDFSCIEIIDFWEADLCAIGLKKGNKLIYISTYNYTDIHEAFEVDFDLEIIDETNPDKVIVVKEFRNASENQLKDEIDCFFFK